ncbi:MAG TPA: c-type cytochrome [Polyangiaceae bacterium]|nr:c-type cytochrome [Polyangiaceae bacterium]
MPFACSSGSGTPSAAGGAGAVASQAGSTSTAGASGSATSSAGASASDAGAGGTSSGVAGANAGSAGASGSAGAGGGSTGPAARGEYLVKNVLGCTGCHTPQLAGGAGPDMTKFLSGVECFAKDPTTMGCLNSANLTNDDTGLKKKTDQQIKDAFTKGLDPDAPTPGSEYLFAQMPYYQFANLSDDDANAIVAYLRTVPPVVHASENGAPFDKQPAAAQWTPVVPANLPAPVNAAPADAASAANGKYLATLACSTCHTANTSATSPLQLDASKGFQGGKEFTTSVMVNNVPTSKKIQSANLTPDATGLKDWTLAQIATAIKTAKDDKSVALCSPMRGLPNITDQDAMDIAVYLKAIAPVANARTEMCQ